MLARDDLPPSVANDGIQLCHCQAWIALSLAIYHQCAPFKFCIMHAGRWTTATLEQARRSTTASRSCHLKMLLLMLFLGAMLLRVL